MGLSKCQHPPEKKYTPEYIETCLTRINWRKWQEEKRSRLKHLLDSGCSGKQCAHCRLIDVEESKMMHKDKSRQPKGKTWYAKLPYSRAFSKKKDGLRTRPAVTASATRYEVAMSNMCNVPIQYILDITRGTTLTRVLPYCVIVEECQNNKDYCRYVTSVMNKRFLTKLKRDKKPLKTEKLKETINAPETSEWQEVRAKTKAPYIYRPNVTQEGYDITKQTFSELCRIYLGMTPLHARVLLRMKTADIRKIILKYTTKAHEVAFKNTGHTFHETVRNVRVDNWTEQVRKYCKDNVEKFEHFTKQYFLKPLREILIIEKDVKKKNYSISEFTKKVRYFKDNGTIARATEGKTLEEVIKSRREMRQKENVIRYFKDEKIAQKYPGKGISEIKKELLKVKYPFLEIEGTLEEMKSQLQLERERITINNIKTKYPVLKDKVGKLSDVLKDLQEYKATTEYAVNAYFKDGGATAKKYPGKNVTEIKEIRLKARISRRQSVVPSKPVHIPYKSTPVKAVITASGLMEWSGPEVEQETSYRHALKPETVEFVELPPPKREVMTVTSLKIDTSQKIETVRKVPYEKKTTVIYHVGSVPLRDKKKQIIQSYSADVKASAGFARISAARYPPEFRETLRQEKPVVGSAHRYRNVHGTHDVCLITKQNSFDATSKLEDVERALKTAAEISKKTVHMPKIETGCNKHSWSEVEPIVERTMKGKTVHVYSFDKPENYGQEPTNGKRVMNGKLVRVAAKGDVMACCRHSLNKSFRLGTEKDLEVTGVSQSEFIRMVLEGEFDSCIRNSDAKNLRKGKSGKLLKECWTKNAERVDWLEGPAGRYCMVSGRDEYSKVHNSLKVAKPLVEYWQSDTAVVLYTEMLTFTPAQIAIRTEVAGWIQNLIPSRNRVIPYHVHNSGQGKVIVMANHRSAPRLCMHLGFYTYVRGDFLYISTYAITKPEELWTTILTIDNKVKVMETAEVLNYQVINLQRKTFKRIEIDNKMENPYGLSGLYLGEKKILQAVKYDTIENQYTLGKVYKGYSLDLTPDPMYKNLFTDAVRASYHEDVELGVKTYSGGFSIHMQPARWNEIAWLQTMGFTFGNSTYNFGNVKREWRPCQDKEQEEPKSIAQSVAGAIASALTTTTTGTNTGVKPKTTKKSAQRKRSRSRARRIAYDERKKQETQNIIDEMTRIEERMRILKLKINNQNSKPRRARSRSKSKRRTESWTFSSAIIAIIGILFLLAGFSIAGVLEENKNRISVESQSVFEQSASIDRISNNILNSVKEQERQFIDKSYTVNSLKDNLKRMKGYNEMTRTSLDKLLDVLEIEYRQKRYATPEMVQKTIDNAEKAALVCNNTILTLHALNETLNNTIKILKKTFTNNQHALKILQDLSTRIQKNTDTYVAQLEELEDIMGEEPDYENLSIYDIENEIDRFSSELHKTLSEIEVALRQPALRAEQHSRARRAAGEFLAIHCRVGSALGLRDEESCCFLKPNECDLSYKATPCNTTTQDKHLGRSTVGCQLAYTGRYITHGGKYFTDLSNVTQNKRCSMSCLTTKMLFEILSWQTPVLSCICGFQGLLFKINKAEGSANTPMDLQIYRNSSMLKGNTTYLMSNSVDFNTLCCPGGTLVSRANETEYRDGWCMCATKKIDTLSNRLGEYKYSHILEFATLWCVTLYITKMLGCDNIFLLISLGLLGLSYYANANCKTDNYIVFKSENSKNGLVYLNIKRDTCFYIGEVMYQVEGIYEEMIYNTKEKYVYKLYTECESSGYECLGGISEYCEKETDCKKQCNKVVGIYYQDCKMRSGFSFSDCLNVDVNVRGEMCISWSNQSLVQHLESSAEAVDQYVLLHSYKNGVKNEIRLSVGTDNNDDYLSVSSLTLSKAINFEHVYVYKDTYFCSYDKPNEDDICAVSYKNNKAKAHSDCSAVSWKWDLKKKSFESSYQEEHMNVWLQERTSPCFNMKVIENSTSSVRIRHNVGSARITISTAEATDFAHESQCDRVQEVRIKVSEGKGEWLTTSIVTIKGTVDNRCLLVVTMEPCLIVDGSRRVVEENFEEKFSVACGVRTASKLQIMSNGELVQEVKLPKLVRDINYDITYGVQTVQMVANRVSDMFSGLDSYTNTLSFITNFSRDMITSVVKLMLSLGLLYFSWIFMMNGMTVLSVVTVLASTLPWMFVRAEDSDAEEPDFDMLTALILLILVIILAQRPRSDKTLNVLMLLPYCFQVLINLLAKKSIFNNKFHTANYVYKILIVAMCCCAFQSWSYSVVFSCLCIMFIDAASLISDFREGLRRGVDIQYEHRREDYISLTVARVIPNREWISNVKVAIDGMSSPLRRLNAPILNKQAKHRFISVLKSGEPQVYMHEVVSFFMKSREDTISFGTCTWNRVDEVLTGCKHTLKLCGCNMCINHKSSFDVVGATKGEKTEVVEKTEEPTLLSGHYDKKLGVYHGYYKDGEKWVEVWNNCRFDESNDKLKEFCKTTQNALEFVQEMRYEEDVYSKNDYVLISSRPEVGG